MKKKYTVVITGMGYVGLSNAVLLAQHNKVIALDVVEEKVNMVNSKKSPIVDKEIEEFLANETLDLTATTDAKKAYSQADIIIISTPTNYFEDKNYFDTSSVENEIEKALSCNRNALIVIKSTIPIGYTKKVIEKFNYDRILFSPEFLREGCALYDNLYPSRIVVGVSDKNAKLMELAKLFANLLSEGARKADIPVLYTGLDEAESIKLFANAYLAMRVSFFNELDTFAELKNLNTREIIDGVALDPRVGTIYNNPSFGYGGYCLPKDTKQLLAHYNDVPEQMIKAIVNSNSTRKEHIANQIFKKASENKKNTKPVIGIYRLVMKSGSDNFRESAIQDIMVLLQQRGADIVIYEPTLSDKNFNDFVVENNIEEFIIKSDIIVANRNDGELDAVAQKVYSRDLFSRD